MALKKVGNIYGTGGLKKVGNINDQNFNIPQAESKPSRLGSAWNWTTNQLIKPVASASNLLEDTGKTLAFPIAKMAGYKGSWQDAKKSQGIDFLGHQKDVLGGANKRTYSDITRDAFKDGSKAQQRAGQIVGYGGDFLLDPLNKLKIAALTAKGINAAKTGKVALSVAEQAKQGQRALIQLGKWNVLPSVGNRVLAGSTKLNDVIRGTETGKKLMTIGSKVSGKIRPGGVSREEFKILTDAKTAARDTVGYTTGKAIEFAKGLAKELKKRKATDFDGSQLLHAIEKGREDLAPEKLKDLWKVGTDFKVQNEEAWKKLGGSVLDNYGMAHVATKEVAESMRKKALQGGKLFSTQTPQDIHRQWVRVTPKGESAGLKVGDFVKAGDRGNYGRVMTINGDKAIVKFTNKAEKTTASVELSLKELENINSYLFKPSIVNLDDVGIEYGRLEKNKYNVGNILDSVAEELRNKGKKPVLGTTKKFTPDEILRGALEEMGGNKKNSPLNRRQLAYQASTNRKSPLKTSTLDNVYHKGQREFEVSQASAMEINNALVGQGKKAIFQEDLPLAAARMGISTGRKQAGVEFLEAVKGLKSEEAIKLANETYEKMTNPEYLRKAVEMFDSVQNIWKAQALVAPSYHIRNFAGNLWNNFLADVKTPAYAVAGNLQRKMAMGSLTEAESKLVKEMEQHGVIGTGQYGNDIAKTLADETSGAQWLARIKGHRTPIPAIFSQKFAPYRANRAIGSTIEDNAKIAHFLSKRAEGYGVKEAAESVKKYLFDYGDLTNVEKGLFKRIMPFYTWTSKNIPLQIQQFIENPGKFSKIATAKKDIEQGVEQPNEKYMSDYMSSNAPVRVKTDENGNTMYFLMGQWLPAASALQFLSQPLQQSIGMATPLAKLPIETLLNKSSFFQNTLGEYDSLQKFPGQKTSYLGMDINPKTANALRTIRPLNEFDKLNPGNIFGGKNQPSMWQGILENASNQRGGRFTPETSQEDRVANAFIGKLNSYNTKDAKYFYDKDTQTKVSEYDAEISRAKKNNQLQLAEKLIKQRNEFKKQRNGSDIFNKSLNPYYK